MQLFENISMAFASVRSNKMRSLLTMLGIIIGIAAVIAIVTVGNSMTGLSPDPRPGKTVYSDRYRNRWPGRRSTACSARWMYRSVQ